MRWRSVVVLGLFSCAVDVPSDGAPSETPSTQRAALGTDDGPSFLFERRGEVFDPRMATTPVIDPLRKRVMAFGGWSYDAVRGDTLEWDGLGWQRRVSSGQPGPRYAASVVYDARFRRALLFSGFSATSPTVAVADNLLWEWDGSEWATLPAANPPASRGGAAAAMDRDGVLWVFSGSVASEGVGVTVSDELLRFDGRAWSAIPRQEPWPAPRALATMAYDPVSGTLLMFGGFGIFNADALGYPAVGEPFNDAWAWDGTRWTELTSSERPYVEVIPFGETPIPLSGRHTLLERNGELVLVHEAVGGMELWRYDAAAGWVNVYRPQLGDVAPNFRLLSSAFVDPVSNDIVVYGGVRTNAPLGMSKQKLLVDVANGADVSGYFDGNMSGERWHYDGQRWREVEAPADPGPRQGASMAYDPERGESILFGGRIGDAFLNDTWRWDGGRWARVKLTTPRPSPRVGYGLAFHPGLHKIVLFGGEGPGDELYDDTWAWSGTSWEKLTPAPGPLARRNPVLVRREGVVVLFGGRTSTGSQRDGWQLTAAGEWAQLAASPNVPPLYSSCATSLDDRAPYLFGGIDGSESTSASFLHMNGESWERVGVSSDFHPESRRNCALVGDAAHHELLFGAGLGGAVDSTWMRFLVEPSVWQVMTPRSYDRLLDPPRRTSSLAYVYDARARALTFYGGSATGVDALIGETWRIRRVGDECGAGCDAGLTCVDGVCCEASSCGACESCAMPGNRGVCTPRGAIESVPGCTAEDGLACSMSGRCRAANGERCTEDGQCASNACAAGVCCAPEGCAQSCIDETSQRNLNGSITSCGNYLCRGSACLSACTNIDDCSAGNVCSDGKCVGARLSDGEDPGGCNAAAQPSAWWMVMLLALRRAARRSGNGAAR